jgi:hypothetical protein
MVSVGSELPGVVAVGQLGLGLAAGGMLAACWRPGGGLWRASR